MHSRVAKELHAERPRGCRSTKRENASTRNETRREHSALARRAEIIESTLVTPSSAPAGQRKLERNRGRTVTEPHAKRWRKNGTVGTHNKRISRVPCGVFVCAHRAATLSRDT